MSSNKGYSLVEVVIATGLMGVLALGILTGVGEGRKSITQSRDRRAKSEIVSNLVESFQKQLTYYEISFDPHTTLPDVANLPLAWSGTGRDVMPVSDCPGCPGRLGYVITPLADQDGRYYRGLYRIKLRISHGTFFQVPTDLEFVSGMK